MKSLTTYGHVTARGRVSITCGNVGEGNKVRGGLTPLDLGLLIRQARSKNAFTEYCDRADPSGSGIVFDQSLYPDGWQH
jgi:hypothetical protein